jgi:putative RecB family exonuclease
VVPVSTKPVHRDPQNPETWALPARLSPSRAIEYAQCPRRFFYRSVVGLPDPPTAATAKGTWVHSALEDTFDLPADERTLDAALAALAAAADRMREDEQIAAFIDDPNVAAGAAEAVRNWFTIEDPRRFEPHGRELRMDTKIGRVPVVGVIDRIDRLGDGWCITDYKTGKQPDLRWAEKAFFAMRVYAALTEQELGGEVSKLRLVYLSRTGPDAVLAMTIGRAEVLAAREEMSQRWSAITRSARLADWPTRTSALCGWCPFSDICPAQHPELEGVDGIPVPVALKVPGVGKNRRRKTT